MLATINNLQSSCSSLLIERKLPLYPSKKKKKRRSYSKLDFYSRVSHGVLFSVSAWLLCPPLLRQLLSYGRLTMFTAAFYASSLCVSHLCLRRTMRRKAVSPHDTQRHVGSPWMLRTLRGTGFICLPTKHPSMQICDQCEIRELIWTIGLVVFRLYQPTFFLSFFLYKHILLCYRWHCRTFGTQTFHF